MKKILLPLLMVFSLAAGIISGIAYERFTNREECLKEAFSETPADLSPEEIANITKALNSETEEGENVEPAVSQDISNTNENKQSAAEQFVGSRNSNKFYPIDCRFAKLIKEENKVFFETVEEGEQAGRKYVECK
ncbi:MAG: hypothetical protein V1690_01635 [Candidatus Moraniibacteriota bacterium]